jgi:hypothetical protein
MHTNKVRLYSAVFAASIGGALVLLGACGTDEDSPTPGVDASPDQQTTQNEGGADVRVDAPMDGGQDADAALPPLCVTYPNTKIDGGVGVDGGEPRYRVIARNAFEIAHYDRCELTHVFDLDDYDNDGTSYFDDQPDGFDCLEKNLEALTGCKNAGGLPIVYESALDQNLDLCAPDAGPPSMWLGFRLNDPNYPPSGTYVRKDVELFIEIVRNRAIATGGYSPADADRLAALMRTQIARVATADAGADGGYSNSICP